MSRHIAPLSDDERAGFIAAARSLVGVPFRHRGRSARSIDCLGVVAYALRAIGREPVDRRVYGRVPNPDAAHLCESLRAHFGEPVSEITPGCVVSMHWHGVPNHVAVVGDYPLGGVSLIHALASEQRVIEHRYAAPWDRRTYEIFRP